MTENGEADCYLNLGTVYQSVGECETAREHFEKSLAMKKEMGDRNGEADCYQVLGTMHELVDEYQQGERTFREMPCDEKGNG